MKKGLVLLWGGEMVLINGAKTLSRRGYEPLRGGGGIVTGLRDRVTGGLNEHQIGLTGALVVDIC
jgi:hypothetical protein